MKESSSHPSKTFDVISLQNDDYCSFTRTNITRYIKDFSTTGGETNISNLDSGFTTDGYEDATDMVVSQYAGGTINFNVVSLIKLLTNLRN